MKVSGLLESVHFSQPYFVVPAIDGSQSCSAGIFFKKMKKKVAQRQRQVTMSGRLARLLRHGPFVLFSL